MNAFVAVFALGTLLFVSNAQATTSTTNHVNIKLSVVMQVPAVENPTNVFTYEALQYKLTNKEMLQILSILYPGAIIPGTILTVGNSGTPFVLIFPNGTMQSVSTSHFVLDANDNVRGGVENTLNSTIKEKIFGTGGALLDLNAANLFELAGGIHAQRNMSGPQSLWSVLFKLAGQGKLSDSNIFLMGTILVRYQSIAP